MAYNSINVQVWMTLRNRDNQEALTTSYSAAEAEGAEGLKEFRDEKGFYAVGKDGVNLLGVLEIGELAASAEAIGLYDKIEVTTLADTKHMYIDGLLAENDTSGNTIAMKFLYHPGLWKSVADDNAYTSDVSGKEPQKQTFTIVVPGGKSFSFEGQITKMTMDSITNNSALTMTFEVSPTSQIELK